MIEFNVTWQGYAIASAAGTNFNPDVDTVIARSEGDRLLGGVIFQNFTGASIRMHMASFDSRAMNRDILWAVFHYPFVQLGCELLLGEVPSNNKKALDIDKKLGFKPVARIEGAYPDGDLVVMAMRREECRWLNLTPRTIKPGSSNGSILQRQRTSPA